jgi:hypothetical protein
MMSKNKAMKKTYDKMMEKIPIMMDSTKISLQLWDIIRWQVRTVGNIILGLDLGAVIQVFKELYVHNIGEEIQKMNIIFLIHREYKKI